MNHNQVQLKQFVEKFSIGARLSITGTSLYELNTKIMHIISVGGLKCLYVRKTTSAECFIDFMITVYNQSAKKF